MWNSARTAISCPCCISRPERRRCYMCEHCRNIQTWRKFDALGTDIAIRLLRSVKEFGGNTSTPPSGVNRLKAGPFKNPTQLGQQVAVRMPSNPRKFQTLIPAIQHQHIHHTPAAVRAGVLPCPANADGRFLASGSLDHRKAGVEVELDFLALLVRRSSRRSAHSWMGLHRGPCARAGDFAPAPAESPLPCHLPA